MKLAQRIVLGFYRNKLKALALVSPRKAAEEAFKLLCTPYTKRKYYTPPVVFELADKVTISVDKETVTGFIWKPENYDNGKQILICHGFDSNSYRFEHFVTPLLEKGFSVIAFDAPAHGTSTGKTINAHQYRNLILKINKEHGPIQGFIAHSFGGIAVALAIEQMEDNAHKRLVLIAPATETTRSIDTFFGYIPVTKEVREAFDKLIEEVGGNPASWFSVSRIIQNITTPTLFVQDRDDTITPFSDMEHLIEKQLPHIQFEITEGLGHSDIYKNPVITDKIVQFLNQLNN